MLWPACMRLAVDKCSKSLLAHLAHIAGEQNSHEFVFPLQLAGHQREWCSCVGAVALLLAHKRTKKTCSKEFTDSTGIFSHRRLQFIHFLKMVNSTFLEIWFFTFLLRVKWQHRYSHACTLMDLLHEALKQGPIPIYLIIWTKTETYKLLFVVVCCHFAGSYVPFLPGVSTDCLATGPKKVNQRISQNVKTIPSAENSYNIQCHQTWS